MTACTSDMDRYSASNASPIESNDDTATVDSDFVVVSATQPQRADIPPIFNLPKLNGHDLFEITVDELQHHFACGDFSSEEYVQFCLDRIQAVNPYLEALIETNPDALATARQFDNERRDGCVRGPLHGIPVLVKDVSYPRRVRHILSSSCHSKAAQSNFPSMISV